jgi:undecaprenyl-diphosphatase
VFRQAQTLLEWLGGHSVAVMAAVLVVVVGTWGFIELLDEVREGDTRHFDEWVIQRMGAFRGSNHPRLEEAGRDLTALGGVVVLTLITLFVAGFLLLIRRYSAFWLVLIATGGGLAISSALKYAVDRQRPDFFEHLSYTTSSSFPSGHSMLSAVVYLTLGSLLTRLVKGHKRKIYFLMVAMTLTFLVGISRIYLGVHWPTDVLAGWTAGLVWAILCWLVARYLQQRGTVATEDDVEQDNPT